MPTGAGTETPPQSALGPPRFRAKLPEKMGCAGELNLWIEGRSAGLPFPLFPRAHSNSTRLCRWQVVMRSC